MQPMKVVASGLLSEGSVVLGSQEGSWSDIRSLCDCIKASCMLPGLRALRSLLALLVEKYEY